MNSQEEYDNMLIEDDNIESENLYDLNNVPPVSEPFNPKDVDISSRTMVISNIIEQLKDGEIILQPDYQRRPNLWSDKEQSRLIESLIIRIPLPSFYFDSDGEKLIVVDGLQRLTAIRRFAVLETNNPNKLRLANLEYLTEYNGLTYEELPVSIQRRIRQTEITAYIIRQGTPDNVRNSIFTRINTVGLRLTAAEIRNAIFRGQAAEFLRELADSDDFKKATRNGVKPDRMEDCEFVNRFLAFYLLEREYRGNLEEFYNHVLKYIKQLQINDLIPIREAFLKSMKYAVALFGSNAFRRIDQKGKYTRINKPLFECVSVSFARMDSNELEALVAHKHEFIEEYKKLFNNDVFSSVISNGTAKVESVQTRFDMMGKTIRRVLGND